MPTWFITYGLPGSKIRQDWKLNKTAMIPGVVIDMDINYTFRRQ